jgi:hypothetical protein
VVVHSLSAAVEDPRERRSLFAVRLDRISEIAIKRAIRPIAEVRHTLGFIYLMHRGSLPCISRESIRMGNHAEQAKKLRNRAEQCRVLAEMLVDTSGRTAYCASPRHTMPCFARAIVGARKACLCYFEILDLGGSLTLKRRARSAAIL